MNLIPSLIAFLITILCLFGVSIYYKFFFNPEKNSKLGGNSKLYLLYLRDSATFEIVILLLPLICLLAFLSEDFWKFVNNYPDISTWLYPIISVFLKLNSLYTCKKKHSDFDISEIQNRNFCNPSEIYDLEIFACKNSIQMQEKKLDILKILSPISVITALLPNILEFISNLQNQKISFGNINFLSLLILGLISFVFYDTYFTYKTYYQTLNTLELFKRKAENPKLFEIKSSL